MICKERANCILSKYPMKRRGPLQPNVYFLFKEMFFLVLMW